jgi:hypothetical protein
VTTIAKLSKSEALTLERRLQKAVHGASTLEAAAQRYVETVYAALADSLALLRLFVTVPYRRLPETNRAFVDALVERAGAQAALGEDTPVLSLLGTMGVEAAWCDRHRSTGHIGIPLLSQEFVSQIPMIARMLKQLGVTLDWLDGDEAVVGKTFGIESGVFYVAEAASAVDGHGRKIISAQDFVARYGIETVYGLGGGYVHTPVFATIIGFCRERVEREQVELLRPHVARFKAETEALVARGSIFTD